jgi:glycosyltransferase involved in cell wall biosynthesis
MGKSYALVSTPTVHTLHNLFTPDNQKLFTYHRQQPYVSISQVQQGIKLNYLTTYKGIEAQDYPFIAQPQEPYYLAFLGRFYPQKGLKQAIAIAKQTGWPVKIVIEIQIRSHFN